MANLKVARAGAKRIALNIIQAGARVCGRHLGDDARRMVASAFLGYPLWRLPGHFYSPLPDLGSATTAATRAADVKRGPPDVELSEDRQLDLLESLAPLYDGLGLPTHREQGWCFYHENTQFAYADAILLNLLLRHWRPAHVVEIGSGFSTAVMIDTVERYFDDAIEITCIEPYPDRLDQVVGELPAYVTLIESGVQDVPHDVVDVLGPGDVLFIDSTHVAKTGSDVVYELFELLPSLAAGVRVHFHDICWPFEYPVSWVSQGRAWNEVYAIHSFLSYNREFEVTLFNHMMLTLHRDWFADHMPGCLDPREGAVTGHGLWLRKRTPAESGSN